MLIKELMTPNAEFVDPNTTVKEAAGKMRALDVGFLPIGENDRLVGMVTDRDIAVRTVADGRDPSSTKVGEIMTRKVEYCFDDDDIKGAAKRMKEGRVRRLVVLNRDKRMVGVCSIGDLALRTEGDPIASETLHEVAKPRRAS